jgi:hypothetical protein
MLSDDITGAIGSVFGVIGRVIGGAIRGGILFGALAFATGAIIAAAPAIMAASGIGTVFAAIFSQTALTGGLAYAVYGAAGGAALLGVTSLIPGVSEGFGFKKLLARRQPERIPEPETARSRAPEYVPENPLYQEGRGTALMQKGDNAQGMGTCR